MRDAPRSQPDVSTALDMAHYDESDAMSTLV